MEDTTTTYDVQQSTCLAQHGAVVAAVTSLEELNFLASLVNGIPYLPNDDWSLGSHQPTGTKMRMATADGTPMDQQIIDDEAASIASNGQLRIDASSLMFSDQRVRYICEKHGGLYSIIN